jgi:hypothetical protein
MRCRWKSVPTAKVAVKVIDFEEGTSHCPNESSAPTLEKDFPEENTRIRDIYLYQVGSQDGRSVVHEVHEKA